MRLGSPVIWFSTRLHLPVDPNNYAVFLVMTRLTDRVNSFINGAVFVSLGGSVALKSEIRKLNIVHLLIWVLMAAQVMSFRTNTVRL